jgi:uncharacterized membrane protein YtjA (UPF0391 family)
MSGISGNSTGIQKTIFPCKIVPFTIVMEHYVHLTGVVAARCRTVFFMNSIIIPVMPQGGLTAKKRADSEIFYTIIED